MKTLPTGLMATCLYATAALFTAGAAQAAAQPDTVTLSGYTVTADNVTGALLADHDYHALIDRLAPHSTAFDADEVASSTDLCVAYAATHQLNAARAACHEAVTAAQQDQPGTTLADHRQHDAAVELALANQSAVDRIGR